MDYITPTEASKKWKLGLRRIQSLCANNRIQGAIKVGRQWMIPVTAEQPQDGRTREVRATPDFDGYHFPLLIYTQY